MGWWIYWMDWMAVKLTPGLTVYDPSKADLWYERREYPSTRVGGEPEENISRDACDITRSPPP